MSRLFGDSATNKDRGNNWFNKDFLKNSRFSRSNSSQPNSESDSDEENQTSRREQLWNSLSSNVEQLTDRVFKKDQESNSNTFEAYPLESSTENQLIGTIKQINGKQLKIISQVAEGSTAFLYLVAQIDPKNAHQDIELKGDSLLKIIYSPTPEKLSLIEKEVDFMSQLNHPNIVKFYGSETLLNTENGVNMGFETLIWMEYCQDGNLVDLMNQRIDTKFTEPELLYMFSDICQGVAYMHLSNPPIIHRDLKVENVLISKERKFKLCDFGSSTTKMIPPRTQLTIQQIHHLEEDIQQNTTLQYRAPEMIDLFLRKGLTEKTDIWALGVILYKLCYFITPFEENGQLAILNCRYDFPSSPQYTDGTKSLITSMLQEDPQARPNIVKICERVCQLRKVPCPLSGFESVIEEHETLMKSSISNETTSLQNPTTSSEDLFSTEQPKGPQFEFATENITPMRRGRPKKNVATQLISSFHPDQIISENQKSLSSAFSDSDPFSSLINESTNQSNQNQSTLDNQSWSAKLSNLNSTSPSNQEFDPFSILVKQHSSHSSQNTPFLNENNGDLLSDSDSKSTLKRLPRPPSNDNIGIINLTKKLPDHPSRQYSSPSKPSNNAPPQIPPRRVPKNPSIDLKNTPGGRPALPRPPSGEFNLSPSNSSNQTLPQITSHRLPRPPSNEDLSIKSNVLENTSVLPNHDYQRSSLTSRSNPSRFEPFDQEEQDTLLSDHGYSNLIDDGPSPSSGRYHNSDGYDLSKLKQSLPDNEYTRPAKNAYESIPIATSVSMPPPIPPKPPSFAIMNNLSDSPLSQQSKQPPPIPPKPRNYQ